MSLTSNDETIWNGIGQNGFVFIKFSNSLGEMIQVITKIPKKSNDCFKFLKYRVYGRIFGNAEIVCFFGTNIFD